MKTLPLVSALILGVASIAYAADGPQPATWYTYHFGLQQCYAMGNPARVSDMLRMQTHSIPTLEDLATDDAGKVTEVLISAWTPSVQAVTSTHMFRTKAACDAYAADQRIDTKRYE